MARCNAYTKAGKRCQNKAVRNGRCRVHQRGGRTASSQSSRRSRTKRAPAGRPTGARSPAGRSAMPSPKEPLREVGNIVMENRVRMAITAAALHPKTRRYVAYQLVQIDQKLLAKVASRGAREGLERGLYVAARVGLKAVPIIGWASLAYDAYTVGKIIHDYVEEREESKTQLSRARQ